tara:strand:+ start:1529 stop:1933 length:405 start_codon:yes stop_codon:yes gene_type:complete
MNLLPWLSPILKQVDKLIPDVNAAREHKQAIETAIQNAVDASNLEQIKTNQIEAAQSGIFTKWRPALGWVCVFGLAWNFIVTPLLTWVGFLAEIDVSEVPSLDIGDLMTLLMGMLGMSTLRTYEKMKGVARESN